MIWLFHDYHIDYHWLTIQEQAMLHQSSAIFPQPIAVTQKKRSGTSSRAIWHGARRPRQARQARQAQRRPGQWMVNGKESTTLKVKNNTSEYWKGKHYLERKALLFFLLKE